MERDRILIVNGDESVRNSLYDSLKNDYDVLTTESFNKALQIYKESSFNMVITEINTPETQGIEVLRKFKKEKSDIPIIVVTTYKSVPIAVEAMKIGAYDYITKPFNEDELKLAVLHALEWKKLVEEAKEKRIYQELALLDELTQIYNRRYFDELLKREIDRSARYFQKFSLLMVDIDDFKRCNDTHGHIAGDKVLKKIAQILIQKTRNTDFVARYGGEEFVIIAPCTDKRGAATIAARLVAIVGKEEIVIGGTSKIGGITISVGISTFGEDASEREKLIQSADAALYQAKKLGKNRVCLFGLGPERQNN